jgi:hypothetical protein
MGDHAHPPHGIIILLDETTAHGSAQGGVRGAFKSAATKPVKGAGGLTSPV